jgi:signal transduction histidine kinase
MSDKEKKGLADVVNLLDKGAGHELAANDLVADVLDRLVIDDSDPYFIASVGGYILHANDAYRIMSLASSGAMTVPPVTGGKGELTIDVATIIDEVRTTKKLAQYNERYIIEGDERLFATKYLPVANAVGDVVAVVASFRDTTGETRHVNVANEAQRRFKDFARATSDWFWETDRDLKIKSVSERFTAITGQPGALAVGKGLKALGTLGSNHLGQSSADEALARRVAFRDQLMEIEGPDEAVLKFHLSGVPIFEPGSGEFQGFRGAGMDVTEKYRVEGEAREIRRNLEETLSELKAKNAQLDAANEQARKALNAKNDFLASMSHELRTPLNAIIGFADAMSQQMFGDLDDQYISYAIDILNSAKHLLGLIEDVLDVAVMESGEIALSLQDVMLKDILDQAVSISKTRSQSEGTDLSALSTKTSFEVHADERRAVQIFVNLLTNAFKFTPAGGKVGIHLSDLQRGRIAVTVWDTGVGVDKEDHERIFEKFAQVTDTIYARNNDGVGLGLHISRELARRMGGDILIDSQPGKGSRFTVVLPKAKA